jgi:hypothetical protein
MLLILGLSASLWGGQGARGDEQLDQSFVPKRGGLRAGANMGADEAQTFTVGIGGTLTRIEVLVYRFPDTASGTLVLDVRPTVNGTPVEDDTAVLASVAVSVDTLPAYPGAFISFDISAAGVAVTKGDVLAIVLSSDLPPTAIVYWRGDTGDTLPYPGGEWFNRGHPGGSWTSGIFGPADLGFQTFVDPGT